MIAGEAAFGFITVKYIRRNTSLMWILKTMPGRKAVEWGRAMDITAKKMHGIIILLSRWFCNW